jgi:hypothetical protein
MHTDGDIPVLILAYKRIDSLIEILESCKRNLVKRIYIAIDGFDGDNLGEIQTREHLFSKIQSFIVDFDGLVFIESRKRNVGCAVSMLSACDWVFERESSAIILEDDCVPSDQFFEFVTKSLNLMKTKPNIWLVCGTQFAPENYIEDGWLLSYYSLTWGWATSKNKWLEISYSLKKSEFRYNSDFSLSENMYWKSGARRARLGLSQGWDALLIQQMMSFNKLAILPNVSLVKNVGNDDLATHVKGNSELFNLPLKKHVIGLAEPSLQPGVDNWIRSNHFKISIRHLISTKITFLMDWAIGLRRPQSNLTSRWNASKL